MTYFIAVLSILVLLQYLNFQCNQCLVIGILIYSKSFCLGSRWNRNRTEPRKGRFRRDIHLEELDQSSC